MRKWGPKAYIYRGVLCHQSTEVKGESSVGEREAAILIITVDRNYHDQRFHQRLLVLFIPNHTARSHWSPDYVTGRIKCRDRSAQMPLWGNFLSRTYINDSHQINTPHLTPRSKLTLNHTHSCVFYFLNNMYTATSLGLVSPGAATDGVTPIFSWKKLDDLFLVIAVYKVMILLAVRPRLSTVLSNTEQV